MTDVASRTMVIAATTKRYHAKIVRSCLDRYEISQRIATTAETNAKRRR